MMSVDGKHHLVLVTGGAVGIGSAIVRRFVAGGWDVVCHYHQSVVQAQGLKNEIQSAGRGCDLVQADLSTEDGIERLLEAVKDREVDCLINNAGTYVVQKHFAEINLKELRDSFLPNLAAPFLVSASLFPGMCSRGFGRIVNISSIAAKYGGSALSMHYGCYKRAMEGITRTLAREGAAQGVLVNTVRPGVIDTAFHSRYPKDMQARVKQIPIKKMGDAREVAEMVYYLGSEINTYITGENITVAGGE